MTHHSPSIDENERAPSHGQRRRQALALLALAKKLAALPPAQLQRIQLPEDVATEISKLHGIKAHSARKRQLAYLAKLMRRHGENAFTDVRTALGQDDQRRHHEAAAARRLEALRKRLLDDEKSGLAELTTRHPDIDRQRLRALLRKARGERQRGRPPHAQRELFRWLRQLDEQAYTGADAETRANQAAVPPTVIASTRKVG